MSNPLLGQYIISVKDAKEWTASFQCEHSSFPKAFRFDKEELNALMNDEHVHYVRFYPSIKKNGEYTLIAVGVNSNDKDLVETESRESLVYDFSHPCPPTCDTNSKLYHQEPCKDKE